MIETVLTEIVGTVFFVAFERAVRCIPDKKKSGDAASITNATSEFPQTEPIILSSPKSRNLVRPNIWRVRSSDSVNSYSSSRFAYGIWEATAAVQMQG